MAMGGVCARQDNTQEWRRVIEISIKEVISGVIAEVLWFVFASDRVNVEKWRIYCGICLSNRRIAASPPPLLRPQRSKAAELDKNTSFAGWVKSFTQALSGLFLFFFTADILGAFLLKCIVNLEACVVFGSRPVPAAAVFIPVGTFVIWKRNC